MRLLVVVALCTACGPPSWPEPPSGSTGDEATRFAIEPADPIEGEDVVLTLPLATDGTCHALGVEVRREVGAGGPILRLEPTSPEMCAPVEVAGSGVLIDLGRLSVGRYLVQVGALELWFQVRPASTSPGEPPLWWRAAHAVAAAHRVGSACGPHEEGRPPPRSWSLRSPRLWHQVRAAFPDWDDARVEAEMCAAQSVQIRAVSERELRYRHHSGSLCHTAESIGTVVVHDDGSLEVRAPYVIDGEDVPC